MSAKTIDSNKVFLVVWHVEGYEPSSSIVEAADEDAAWEKVAQDYTQEVMSGGEDDDEIYLDHVKSLSELSEQSGLTLTAAKK